MLEDVKTTIRPGATIRVTLDLTPSGVKHIRVIADTPESRDWAMAKLTSVLPQLELLEAALQA
jgi:hypothetical protein